MWSDADGAGRGRATDASRIVGRATGRRWTSVRGWMFRSSTWTGRTAHGMAPT
ncbi:hypothetical protein [Ornithinimicrobium kibberense]|uniref:hypothetical protein n=1 Tax=Ornithinimicrobium kibberense TaxID=282060 RepID=UPI00360AB697